MVRDTKNKTPQRTSVEKDDGGTVSRDSRMWSNVFIEKTEGQWQG